MKKNPIQFAVVREDPLVEWSLIKRFSLHRILGVGSGGCTAFCLKSLDSALEIDLIDQNPAQLELIKEKSLKMQRVARSEPGDFLFNKLFDVGPSDSFGLNQVGNFESLFRNLRYFMYEFVLDKSDWLTFFNNKQFREANLNHIFDNPYWSTGFKVFFSDSLLKTMFPAYFMNISSSSKI